MAAIAKVGTAVPGGTKETSLSTPGPHAVSTLGPVTAGEALVDGSACQIRADKKVYMSDGDATDGTDRVDGFVVQDVAAGRPATLYNDVSINYTDGATPGTPVYVGATPGTLADAPAKTGAPQVGLVLWDGKRIRVVRSW